MIEIVVGSEGYGVHSARTVALELPRLCRVSTAVSQSIRGVSGYFHG